MNEKPKHTPEPWYCGSQPTYEGHLVVFDEAHDLYIAKVHADASDDHTVSSLEQQANAARIVACVNACTGLNPAAVPALVAAIHNLRAGMKRLAGQQRMILLLGDELRAIDAALALAEKQS